jgi:hypothetical protein
MSGKQREAVRASGFSEMLTVVKPFTPLGVHYTGVLYLYQFTLYMAAECLTNPSSGDSNRLYDGLESFKSACCRTVPLIQRIERE